MQKKKSYHICQYHMCEKKPKCDSEMNEADIQGICIRQNEALVPFERTLRSFWILNINFGLPRRESLLLRSSNLLKGQKILLRWLADCGANYIKEH